MVLGGKISSGGSELSVHITDDEISHEMISWNIVTIFAPQPFNLKHSKHPSSGPLVAHRPSYYDIMCATPSDGTNKPGGKQTVIHVRQLAQGININQYNKVMYQPLRPHAG